MQCSNAACGNEAEAHGFQTIELSSTKLNEPLLIVPVTVAEPSLWAPVPVQCRITVAGTPRLESSAGNVTFRSAESSVGDTMRSDAPMVTKSGVAIRTSV